jgi:hypothetical protein
MTVRRDAWPEKDKGRGTIAFFKTTENLVIRFDSRMDASCSASLKV